MFDIIEQVQKQAEKNEQVLLAATISHAELSNLSLEDLQTKSADELNAILEETNHHLETELYLNNTLPTLHGMLFDLNQDKVVKLTQLTMEPQIDEKGFAIKVSVHAIHDRYLEGVNHDPELKAVCDEIRQKRKEEH